MGDYEFTTITNEPDYSYIVVTDGNPKHARYYSNLEDAKEAARVWKECIEIGIYKHGKCVKSYSRKELLKTRENWNKEIKDMKQVLKEADEKLFAKEVWNGDTYTFKNEYHHTYTRSHDVLIMYKNGNEIARGETTWINRPWHRFDLEEAVCECITKAFGSKAEKLIDSICTTAHSAEDAIHKFFTQFKKEDIVFDKPSVEKIDDSIDGRKNALSKELGKEVIPSEDDEREFIVINEDGEEERYRVLTDDEASEEFDEYVRGLWEDLGLESVSDSFKEYVLENCIDEDYAREVTEEDVQNQVSDMSDEEVIEELGKEDECFDDDGNIKDDVNIDDLREELVEQKVQYIEDTQGFGSYISEFMDSKTLENYIDGDKVVEALKDDYEDNGEGRGAIASYDGHELELEGGLYAYRMD